jgi:predicted deacylase
MSHDVRRVALPSPSPGTARTGELPGVLALNHLLGRLAAAEDEGGITGEIVVVPVANPVGLGQALHGELLGRYDLDRGINFNRGFPELADAVAERVEEALDDDGPANLARIRAAMTAVLDERQAAAEDEALKLALTRLAVDADIVLDLHCDDEALLHLFVNRPQWPAAADLSAQLGSRVTLLESEAGGAPFDEASALPWEKLAARFPERPIPNPCLAATVELRGRAEVSDGLAAADADNLLRFLRRRGLVAGDPGPIPEPLCQATPLEGVDFVAAPAAGLVCHPKELGARVEKGETVAEILDPTAEDPAAPRLALASRTSGILFGRRLGRMARPGQIVCKVAGTEPLPGSRLLED